MSHLLQPLNSMKRISVTELKRCVTPANVILSINIINHKRNANLKMLLVNEDHLSLSLLYAVLNQRSPDPCITSAGHVN